MRNVLFYTLLSFTYLLAATPWDGSLKNLVPLQLMTLFGIIYQTEVN